MNMIGYKYVNAYMCLCMFVIINNNNNCAEALQYHFLHVNTILSSPYVEVTDDLCCYYLS